MSGIALLKDAEVAKWDAFVQVNAQATLFHTSQWKRVIEGSLGHRGYYLYYHQEGSIQGILPLFLCASPLTDRALVALPFAGTQPSVCMQAPTLEQPLLEAAKELAGDLRADYVELREETEKPWPWVARQTYVNSRLALAPDPEVVWSERLESRVRTKVRAARRRGLEVAWGGVERLDEFYAVYAETLHRLGSPAHAKLLFQNVLQQYPGEAELALILDGQQTVAGALVMHDRRWIGFPWAASLTAARAKHPNNLLYWAIIEKACRMGYCSLDLGRSPAGSGTLHFKLQWGAVARPLWYYFGLVRARQAPHRDALDRKMVYASRCWRRLPIRLATYLGPALARLIP